MTAPSRAQVGVASYGVAPVETVRLARPQLVWRVSPTNGNVKEVRMLLNGKSIPAQYSAGRRTAFATLSEPLPPGPYDVRCELIMDTGRTYPKVWSFKVADGAIPKTPEVPAVAETGMTVINQLRQKMGLPLCTLDARLCAAARDYARLLSTQSNSQPEHLPELPELVKAYCYPGQCFESVGIGYNPANTLIRSFFDGPYHRSSFMQPGICDVGIGVAGDKTRGFVVTLLFSLCEDSAIMVYPRDGQKDVPLDWNADEESNNPLRLHNAGGGSKVGYPITLFAMSPYGTRLENVKATLTTESGVAVPFYLNTPDNDKDNLDNGVILIPRQPLKPGTTYKITVTAQSEQEDAVTKTWQFTTVATAVAKAP